MSLPPTTPQRAGPGAFVNTPAPNRPGLNRNVSMQGQQIAPAAPAVTAPSYTPIERAARTINEMLEKDRRFRDVESVMGQGMSGEYDIAEHQAWTPFQKLRTYEIPERIFEQVNQVNISTSMGLFAEINHAWVAVDNQLYLWDYTAPNPQLVGFEEQPHVIASVKLVKPRKNVFLKTISHLLVIATVSEIFLIGVETQRGPEGVHTIQLYRTGFQCSIRGLTVSTIAGSDKTGRIFFGDGRDSEDVYELNYQPEEKWFSSKCSKTNHVKRSINVSLAPFFSTPKRDYIVQMEVDDTRNVLYTLSSDSTIRVFYIRTVTKLDLVIAKTIHQIRSMCIHFVHQSELLGTNMKITSITPISATEAGQLSLLATTSTGLRIFLSTTTSGGYHIDSPSEPNSMQVKHIRFPPPEGRRVQQTQTPSNQLQPYQTSAEVDYDSRNLTTTTSAYRYAPGSFFCFVKASNDQGNDILFASAPHIGKINQDYSGSARFFETAQTVALGGIVQDVGLVSAPFAAADKPLGFGNELAVQFDKPQAEFAIMTHNGIETVRRRRLVDTFAAIIKYGGGSEGIEGDIRKLSHQYGMRELTSAALAVACGQGSDIGPDSRVAKISDPDVLEYARKTFTDFGGKATLSENVPMEGITVDNVIASPRHDGIAMYITRLVRSIWDSPIIKENKTPNGSVLEQNHSTAKLQEIQRALVNLQRFLHENKQFIDGLGGPEALGRASSRQAEVELQGENRALTSLVQLINNIVEGIAFALVLFDERLEDILALLPADSRAKVLQLTYQGLFSVSQGKDLGKDLVKAIVNRNIMKGSNVETVAEGLRRKCGSFCSHDDVIIFRAQENLKKAGDAGGNVDQARVQLNDSLALFEQVAKSLGQENLTAAVSRYIELQFYAGAIRLALKAAQAIDRGNKALSWIKEQKPTPDAREKSYLARTAYYDLIFQVIEAVEQAASNQVESQNGVLSQIGRRKLEAYNEINESEDEVFQFYLFDWYLSQGWQDRLLGSSSTYVPEYLQQNSSSNVAQADLLSRYYTIHQEFLSAAEVQFELATSDLPLSLEKRIEYLSRAKANASTRKTGFSDIGARNRQSRQELLRNINDHLDIANIQDDVLQKFVSDQRWIDPVRKQEMTTELNGKIMDLTKLYVDFVDKAGYYDISLLIFQAADHRDLSNVRSTWTNFIDASHHNAMELGHSSPWEVIASDVVRIGRRLNKDENIFPVNIVLQLLLQYYIQSYTPEGNTNLNANREAIRCSNFTWPIDVFIDLDIAFEGLLSTLEALWYAQERPFQGAARKSLVKWIIYTVEQWYKLSNQEGLIFGGEDNAAGIAEVLRVVIASDLLNRRDADDREWLERARVITQEVDAAVRSVSRRSIRGL